MHDKEVQTIHQAQETHKLRREYLKQQLFGHVTKPLRGCTNTPYRAVKTAATTAQSPPARTQMQSAKADVPLWWQRLQPPGCAFVHILTPKLVVLFGLLICTSLSLSSAPQTPQRVIPAHQAAADRPQLVLQQWHTAEVESIACSPDDTLLVAAGKDGAVRTPLMFAVSDGYLDITRDLLAKGAKVNVRDGLGYTPLTYAVGRQDATVVKLLLDQGADVQVRTKEKESLLQLVKQSDAHDAFGVGKLLRQAGEKE